jgi:branched-chain amino acid transport system permease protein
MHSLVQNIVDALTFGSLYALFALGIALVFGIMRLINFAHGSLIMIGGFALVLLDGMPLALRLPLVLAIVVAAALAMERVAFRSVRDASPATMLITSFALSYLLQSLAILILGTLPRSTNLLSGLTKSFDIAGISVQWLDVVTIVVTIALLVALTAFLARTSIGVQLRAAAEDFRMARVLGVRANSVMATAFAISGLLAGVASVLLVAQGGVVSTEIGSGPVLVAFIATVLGGMGSMRGAVLGGLALGVITVALQAYLPVELRYYRDAFAYSAVIAVLLMRPQGLFVAASVRTRV